MFAVPGAAQGLVQLLNSTTSPELLLEVAWVLCHASFSQADVNRLVHLGLLKAVIRQSSLCLQAVSTTWPGPVHRYTATSCMRNFQGLLFCLTTDSFCECAAEFDYRSATAHLQVICFVGTGKYSLHHSIVGCSRIGTNKHRR